MPVIDSVAPVKAGTSFSLKVSVTRRVAPTDEHAFQALALELQRDRAFPAHSISLNSSASLATVFMLRAVPVLAAGMRSFDWPTPSG